MNILVIGAHPDDCEVNTAGLCLKLKEKGHRIKYLCATNGCTGHYEMGGGALVRRRESEFREACAIAGFECEMLDIPNNEIEPNIFYRKLFVQAIRLFETDVIITCRPNDYHADHRYTSILVLDCITSIRIPNVCPLTPHLRRNPVLIYHWDKFQNPSFAPDIAIGIDDKMDMKFDMLHCHKSQMYEWLPWEAEIGHQVPREDHERRKWLPTWRNAKERDIANLSRELLVRRYGPGQGRKITSAEAFQFTEYSRQLTDHEQDELFGSI
ncbi:MAG: hypothetical protein A2096_17085 [Spirochaetes bacterium GWF1_41_5]|nr:MAG: hypothetical protein A2096_17085 [Spirochaetes bacterium GWF1_41_5]HBE02714.1 GlcNAc-PI de-N-acetylase [Spirochaetia bacterium]